MSNFNIQNNALRTVVEKEIPFLKGAFISFYDSPTAADLKKANQLKEDQDFDSSLDFILSQIADWNLSDDNGKLEVNRENLERLPINVINWIAQAPAGIIKEHKDKKKESPSSL